MSHSFLTLHDLRTDRQQGRAGGGRGGRGRWVEVSGNQRWSGRAERALTFLPHCAG